MIQKNSRWCADFYGGFLRHPLGSAEHRKEIIGLKQYGMRVWNPSYLTFL